MWRAAGARKANEDFAAALRPRRAMRCVAIAAIADGVSSGGRGREAAQTRCSRCWPISSPRRRPGDQRRARSPDEGAERLAGGAEPAARRARRLDRADHASPLVLQGQGWTVAHVGDTRVWRIAGGEIQQLTQDHAYAQPDQRNWLTRAVGLDDLLHVDYCRARCAHRRPLRADQRRRARRAGRAPRRWPRRAAAAEGGRGAGRGGAGSRQQGTTSPRWC